MPPDPDPAPAVPPENPADDPKPNPNHDGTVSIESHNKLLGEHKRGKEKLASATEELEKFKAAELKREETELEKLGEHEKIIKIRDDRIVELEAKDKAQAVRNTEASRLSAFFKGLDGEVDEKYWSLIDTSKINVDPDTGEVDALSVAASVESFKNEFGTIIKGQNVPTLPNGAPANNAGALTPEQYNALPLAEKKARLAEFNQSIQK